MALRVLVTLLGLSMTVNCSRVNARGSDMAKGLPVPEDVKEALNGWLHQHEYKYVIMTVPDFEISFKSKEGNYADFRRDFMSCTGVCIAAFDFAWQVPRGHGSVPATEPAFFTWAPDTTPDGLSGMGYMRLKMQMPMAISSLKGALGDWNGQFIETNGPEELDPAWVVPKLKGGRMGNRKEKLNPEGMALWDLLTKELKDVGVDYEGGTGSSSSDPAEKPKPKPEEPSRPETTWKPPPKPVPSAPDHGFTAMSHDEIQAMIKEKVAEAAERKMPEIIAAAEAAARQAVKDATAAKATKLARDATTDIASLAFEQAAQSIEG